jgi:hypothetical protein
VGGQERISLALVSAKPCEDADMAARQVLFEGFTDDEILKLPRETIAGLVLLGEPIVFRVGSSTILGSFNVDLDRLVVELAQIDSVGEGVLVSLGSLARR